MNRKVKTSSYNNDLMINVICIYITNHYPTNETGKYKMHLKIFILHFFK